MLRSLLEDGFHLRVHHEMVEMNFCALTVGHGGSKLKTYRPDHRRTSGAAHGPVLDQTALTENFRTILAYSLPQDSGAPDRAPDILTAVREQLGLNPESKTGPSSF